MIKIFKSGKKLHSNYKSVDINGGEQNEEIERLVILFCNEAVYSYCEKLHFYRVDCETINILCFY